MPTVTLYLNNQGKLAGVTEKDGKAYGKFLSRIRDLGHGCITFTWREPRSSPYHRRHFAMLNALFEAQEQFDDPDQLRKWLEVGAGYVEFVPGPKGRMVAMPKSIAYDKLDQAEFEPIHQAVFSFARSQHARRFLWSHLSDEEGWQMIESILGEFE